MPTVLVLLTYAILLAATARTAYDALRHPHRQRIDIFIVVGSLALITVLGRLSDAPTRSTGVRALMAFLFLAQPYFMLRLVAYFWRVPRAVPLVALACTVAGVGVIVAWPQQRPPVINLSIATYFVAVQGYAAWAFTVQAARTVGLVSWRLRFAAAGAWVLAAIGVLSAAAAFVPILRQVRAELIPAMAVPMILCYYLGLATPRSLRRSWQRAELYRYLSDTTHRSQDDRARSAAADLVDAAVRSTGGAQAVVLRPTGAAPGQLAAVADTDGTHIGAVVADEGFMARAGAGAAQMTRAEAGGTDHGELWRRTGGVLLAVPIVAGAGEQTWGVIVVHQLFGSLFPSDDLDVLRVLSAHAADAFASADAVEQREAAQRLEHSEERKALEQARQRLIDVFEAAADFVTISQIVGPPTYLNAAIRRRLGLLPDEAVHSMFDLRPAGFAAFFESLMLPALNEKDIWRGETQYLSRAGEIVHVSQISVAHRNAAGEIEFLSTISRDISHERQAAERLRESDAQVRLLARAVESAGEMISVTDLDNRFTFVNAAFLSTYGYSLDEVIGRTPEILASKSASSELLEDIFRDSQRGGWQGELRNCRKDGREISISLTTAVIRSGDGEAFGLLGVARDITESLKTQEALRLAEERMRFSLEASRVGIWESDLRTGVSYWSETCEVLHGLPPGTFAGTFEAVLERVHPDQRAEVARRIESAASDRTDVEFEYDTVWPDGAVRTIMSRGRTFADEAAVPVRAAGVSWDVTERRSLENQLRQSQKMEAIGQLAGGVAHDLNNILTAILGYGELLREDLSPIERRKTANELHDAARRAAALTAQLLAFGRRTVRTPSPTRLSHVVAQLLPMLNRVLGEEIAIESDTAGNDPMVFADTTQLEQVILNLAVNARDAMPDGGVLRLTTGTAVLGAADASRHDIVAGAYATLEVTDTGSGMDEATRAHIFEPFFTTKGVGKGTGLGLSTVFGIVKQSLGTVTVATRPGAGTTFKIWLPASEHAAVPETSSPVHPVPAGSGHETILVVEDEAAILKIAKIILERAGFQVRTARDPAEAMRVVDANPETIDLLLTDMRMPGGTGIDLVSMLAATGRVLPVIFMSGYAELDEMPKNPDGSDGHFLRKPFSATELTTKLREVLDKRR